MNELDLLKTHWQKDQDFIKFKKEDIVTMIHKNSSSIVKWLLIICCLELLLGLSLFYFFPSDPEDNALIKISDWILNIIFYAVILYFIYNFFKIYNNIKNSSNTKTLLESIVAVRKNTDHYIRFNLIAITLTFITAALFGLYQKTIENINNSWGELIFVGAFTFILLVLFMLLFRKLIKLYYKLVYGILLKKLMKNYDDLVAIDTEENS